jgi:hypothetical protein
MIFKMKFTRKSFKLGLLEPNWNLLSFREGDKISGGHYAMTQNNYTIRLENLQSFQLFYHLVKIITSILKGLSRAPVAHANPCFLGG